MRKKRLFIVVLLTAVTLFFLKNLYIIEYASNVVGILCSMSIFNKILEIKYEQKVMRSLVNIRLTMMFLFSSATIAASTYNPFIYFRF